MEKFKRKGEKGITLIALVISIIVLLILAGVTIAALSGDNGLLQRATEAKERTKKEDAEEQSKLSQMNNELQNIEDDGFEESKKVNRPQLTSGMTRIMFNNGKTILDGQSGWDENNWYNYGTEDNNKNWANTQT